MDTYRITVTFKDGEVGEYITYSEEECNLLYDALSLVESLLHKKKRVWKRQKARKDWVTIGQWDKASNSPNTDKS